MAGDWVAPTVGPGRCLRRIEGGVGKLGDAEAGVVICGVEDTITNNNAYRRQRQRADKHWILEKPMPYTLKP